MSRKRLHVDNPRRVTLFLSPEVAKAVRHAATDADKPTGVFLSAFVAEAFSKNSIKPTTSASV